ncbi:tumor suppressor ARF isoform X2 [Scleropages formosus]|uniref:tumor suppressor ARF isoform X2 n=1 Tax=Scleropages formosus TaxID=113540 RepID=UPI0010FA6C1B|nr:tumor suppressor ARF-like isoform X2 [Scleropages formosus]
MSSADELASAAAAGDAERVAQLLQDGAAVDAVNRFGRTPLQAGDDDGEYGSGAVAARPRGEPRGAGQHREFTSARRCQRGLPGDGTAPVLLPGKPSRPGHVESAAHRPGHGKGAP